jgi:hypothetical protein
VVTFLADGVLVLHALFVAFVVFGQIAIVVGLLLGQRWARSFRLRLVHLVCIAFVVVQTWLGRICPLTAWENALRRHAGQAGYERGFIADWLHRLIFYDIDPWIFTLVYTLFGALVVATWILAPPRRRTRR